MKGAGRVYKGKAFERLVANLLTAAGFAAKRGIGQARTGGEVADVEGLADEGWWPECKHGGCSPQSALEQARDAVAGVAREKRRRCAMCKGSGYFAGDESIVCSPCKGTGVGKPRRPRKVEPKPGLTPVAITRSTGGPILVTMDLDAWISLLSDRRALRKLRERASQPPSEVK